MSNDLHDDFFANGVFQITEAEFNEPLFGKNILVQGESKSKDLIIGLFKDEGSYVFQDFDEDMKFDIILAFDDFSAEEVQKIIEKNGLFVCCNGKNGTFYGGEGFKAIRIVNIARYMDTN